MLLILPSMCDKDQTGTALLKFTLLDGDSQKQIPGKIVFVQNKQDTVQLNIPETFGLAPEKNGFYTAFGKGEVTIPAGTFTVYASRGMEYSIDKKKIKFKNGSVVEENWSIEREFDPEGYVSADMHMHTTNSDGHCSEEERVTSLIGENVEFAAMTDHNFVTDLQPAVEKLGVSEYITTCPGNELTTNVGHFNIFPLPPNTAAFDPNQRDGSILFGYRDGFPKPVLNLVNHPRWEGLDYFGQYYVDHVTGETSNPDFSLNFEAMEIMNEPIGWGLLTGSSNKISVWDEWFNLLNKGFRITGIGNSDSHVLLSSPVGYPRNYITSSTDNPAQLNPYDLVQNIIDHKVTVSRGVFVDFVVNGKWHIGSNVEDTDGSVDLFIEVKAPSWVCIDEVKIFGNGREVWSEKNRASKGTLQYKNKITLQPEVDTWYVVKAEGNHTMWPIVPDQHELPVTPVGFTNPIWVDIDGNGFETERDRAKQFIQQYSLDTESLLEKFKNSDWWLQRQVLALIDNKSDLKNETIRQLFFSDVKMARKYAYSKISEHATQDDIQLFNSAKTNVTENEERLLVDTYIAKLSPDSSLLDFMFSSVINSPMDLRKEQCSIISMKQYVKQWQAVGPFPGDNEQSLNIVYKPEEQLNLTTSYNGKDNKKIQWQNISTEENGFVDLAKLTDDTKGSVAYAHSKIKSKKRFKTVLLFGSDDGAVVWFNGQEIYRKIVSRSPNPYDELIPIEISEGENTFLVKVSNGGGDWGLYLEVFDPLKIISLN